VRSPAAPILLLLLLSACATLPPAAQVDSAWLAHLRPELRMGVRVRIVEVDGRELGLFRDRAALAPGTHEILANTEMVLRGQRAFGAHRLAFEAQPGRSYVVRADWHAYGPRIWIEETDSGERVAVAVTRARRLPAVGAR
jgi:hypothetical protein